MSAVGDKIQHLIDRSAHAQAKRDCAGAYYALIQAVKAYSYAHGSGSMPAWEASQLGDSVARRVEAVFDGCIGED